MYMQQSEANLLRVRAMAPIAEATARSLFPLLSWAATELYSIDPNPSSSVVIFLSRGKELPYPAADPSGFWSATLYAPRSIYMSSARLSA